MTRQSLSKSLPPGWRLVRFGDVVRNINANMRNPLESELERFVGLDHLDPESLHIKRWGLIEDGTTFTRKFVTGQVLFGKRRAYQRKVAVAEFDGICSGDILVFEPADDQLLPELLPFIVQSDGFFEHALGTSAGSLSPRTKWQDLARYEFALPPQDEQRHIAEILWAADETACRAEDCIAQIIALESALFEHLLDNGSRDSGWTDVKLGELMTASPKSGHSAVSAGRDTGHYVLILSALSRTGYQSGYLKPVELTAEVQATKLKKGDLLISRSNTIELVGLAGIFNEDREDVSFPDTMMLLLVDECRIDKRFLEWVLLSAQGRSQIQRIAAGTSGSMKKINRTGLSSLRIPLPPLETQKQIVMSLDACIGAQRIAEDKCKSDQKLKAALLKHLLAG